MSANDELFVKLGAEAGTTHPIFDAYYDHFNDAFDRGVQCTKSNWPCTKA